MLWLQLPVERVRACQRVRKNGRAMSDTTTSTLAAALWDFDGTLADTEPFWIAAEYDLISQLGGPGRRSTPSQLVGNSLLDSGSYILNAIGRVDLSPAWVVEQLLGVVLDQVRRTRSSGARERSSCSTPSLRRVFRAHWYRRRTACCWTPP